MILQKYLSFSFNGKRRWLKQALLLNQIQEKSQDKETDSLRYIKKIYLQWINYWHMGNICKLVYFCQKVVLWTLQYKSKYWWFNSRVFRSHKRKVQMTLFFLINCCRLSILLSVRNFVGLWTFHIFDFASRSIGPNLITFDTKHLIY